ncbi:hypothetical protein GGH15_006397, partial [Coemansia sp. RSA 562]
LKTFPPQAMHLAAKDRCRATPWPRTRLRTMTVSSRWARRLAGNSCCICCMAATTLT